MLTESRDQTHVRSTDQVHQLQLGRRQPATTPSTSSLGGLPQPRDNDHSDRWCTVVSGEGAAVCRMVRWRAAG